MFIFNTLTVSIVTVLAAAAATLSTAAAASRESEPLFKKARIGTNNTAPASESEVTPSSSEAPIQHDSENDTKDALEFLRKRDEYLWEMQKRNNDSCYEDFPNRDDSKILLIGRCRGYSDKDHDYPLNTPDEDNVIFVKSLEPIQSDYGGVVHSVDDTVIYNLLQDFDKKPKELYSKSSAYGAVKKIQKAIQKRNWNGNSLASSSDSESDESKSFHDINNFQGFDFVILENVPMDDYIIDNPKIKNGSECKFIVNSDVLRAVASLLKTSNSFSKRGESSSGSGKLYIAGGFALRGMKDDDNIYEADGKTLRECFKTIELGELPDDIFAEHIVQLPKFDTSTTDKDAKENDSTTSFRRRARLVNGRHPKIPTQDFINLVESNPFAKRKGFLNEVKLGEKYKNGSGIIWDIEVVK